MKKQKLAALFLVALLTLSSCGKSASKNSSNQKTEPETTTEKLSTTTEASSEVIEEPTTADNTEVISDDGTASDAEQTSSDITLYDYNSSTGVFRVGHRYTQIPFDWVPRKDKNGNTNLFLINNDERRIVHFITQKERPAEQDQTVIDTYKKSLDKLAIDIKIKYEEQAYYADTLYHTICFYGTINGHYTAGLSLLNLHDIDGNLYIITLLKPYDSIDDNEADYNPFIETLNNLRHININEIDLSAFATDVNEEALYAPILKETKQFLKDQADGITKANYETLASSGIYPHPGDKLDDISYVIEDINEDKIDELIVYSENQILFVLTIRDKQVVPILESTGDVKYQFGSEKYFYATGKSFDGNLTYARFSFNSEDRLELKDGYRKYYYNERSKEAEFVEIKDNTECFLGTNMLVTQNFGKEEDYNTYVDDFISKVNQDLPTDGLALSSYPD